VLGSARAQQELRPEGGAGAAGTPAGSTAATHGLQQSRLAATMNEVNALKIHKTIDEATARAIPELRPLVGRSVELIVLEPAETSVVRPKLGVDEFLLVLRRKRPQGVAPVTVEDMDTAIAEGAVRDAGV
jgi:hypothetical protein